MPTLKKTTRFLIYAVMTALAACALYLYRTLQLGRGDAQPAFLEILNPAGEMLGPEGIQFDGAGNLYVGDANGFVWVMEQGGSPAVYAEMARVTQMPGSPATSDSPHVGGMAFDAGHNLYAACFGFGGGTILRVDAATKEVRFFARDVGVANSLAITRDGKHLWASDCRSDGRLLRYPLADIPPALPDLAVSGLKHPNGLVFGKDEQILYCAETYSGEIARVDLSGDKPRVERIIDLKRPFAVGSLDGLAFDPRDVRQRFLYVAENMRGMFTVVDVESRPTRVVKTFRLAQMGGRPCPASMVIREGSLYFTDLWSCSPIRILLGMPKWHNHVYRFRVLDLSSILHGNQTPAAGGR